MPRGGPDPSPSNDSRRRPFSLAGLPALLSVFALALGFGAWAALTGGLRAMNSDALLPVFASLYRWTPFFWRQTRYGQPLALLATPISNPNAALLFHFVVAHALLVLFAFALARLFLPREKATVAGLGFLALLLLTTPVRRIAFLCLTQPYIQSGAAGLAGLQLVRRGGRLPAAVGWLLLAVAFWIAPTTLFWLAPLALLAGDRAEGRPAGRSAMGIAGGLAALSALSVAAGTLVPDVPRTPVALAAIDSWGATWAGLVSGLFRATPSNRWLWPLAALVVVALLAAWLKRREDRGIAIAPALRTALALVVAAALHLLASGTLAWVTDKVATQGAGWRYAIPTQLLLVAVAPLALAAWLGAPTTTRAARIRIAIAALAVVLIVPAKFGRPSLQRAKRSLRFSDSLHLDPKAHELLQRGATHLLGDYWQVYPIVFRANAIAWERGDRRVIWPISGRAISARDLWWYSDWSQARIALLKDDPWREPARREFALPELETVETGATIDIARGRSGTERRDPEAVRP